MIVKIGLLVEEAGEPGEISPTFAAINRTGGVRFRVPKSGAA